MRVLVGFALSLFVVILFGANTYATPVTDHVVINEIMANPATGEVEWIELYNPTEVAVSMSGWRLVVMSGNFSGVFASDATIAPHGYVVRSASDTTSKLNNISATITLKPSTSGAAIDTVTYGGISQAKTYARECDASDTWVAQALSTQESANCVAVGPPKDETPPIIADVLQSKLTGNVVLPVVATDETKLASVQAVMIQYGTEVGRAEATESTTVSLDTTILPNGPVTLIITATDEAGNMTTKSFELTIENPVPVAPPMPKPVAKPIIVEVSEPEPDPVIEEPKLPAPAVDVTPIPQPVMATLAVATVAKATPAVATAGPVVLLSDEPATVATLEASEPILATVAPEDESSMRPQDQRSTAPKVQDNLEMQIAAVALVLVILVLGWRIWHRHSP
jgi:hypothetical protein